MQVTQGAATLQQPLSSFLSSLKDAGLGSLPGTAAEVLHDEVRATLCPDKLSTASWLEVCVRFIVLAIFPLVWRLGGGSCRDLLGFVLWQGICVALQAEIWDVVFMLWSTLHAPQGYMI